MAYDLNIAGKHAESLAGTDALTGLNNLRAFFDKAESLFASWKRNLQPISALMLDIDHLKKLTIGFFIAYKQS